MSTIHVTDKDFEEIVLKSEKTVLVDFWASWCNPCRMLGPIIDSIAKENDDVVVCKVNVDECPNLAVKYNVMSIPMLLVFKNGEIYKKNVGVISKTEILDMLQ